MRDQTVDSTLSADDVLEAVREIVSKDTRTRAKISALRALGARLGEAAALCQRSYAVAVKSGNRAKMAALRAQHDMLDRALNHVSATAKGLLNRKKAKMGFDTEPCYFVEPRWERPLAG